MAKRKQQPIDKQTLATTRPTEIAQAFNDGNLKRFYDEWQKLCNHLTDSPDLLAQAEHAIAFAITDEGTSEASRLDAFRAVVKVNPREWADYGVLNNVGIALYNFQHYYAAIAKFEQALKLKPNGHQVINNYGNALNNLLRYEEAIAKFEQTLKLKPDYVNALNGYGNALNNLGRHEEAIIKYEQVLKLEPDYVNALNGYAITLSDLGRYDEAIAKFEEALKLNTDDLDCWNNYGYVLNNLKRYDEAITKFEHVLKFEPQHTEVLLNYGLTLIELRKYKEAIAKLEQSLNTPKGDQFANFIYLTLGSLHYRIQQEAQAKYYFDRLLEISDDKDALKIGIAQEMFTINPDSDEAFELLDEVIETSPYYQQAYQIFGRHAADKRHFDKFKTSDDDITVKDTQALNRSMYHKIANEMAILKELAYEVVADYPTKNILLQQIVTNIQHVTQGVQQRREAEKAKVQAIQPNNYEQILHAIEQTAHNVSDFVNNELAVIAEEIRFALHDDPNAPSVALSELLGQIKITQAALNDLKDINEGIIIKSNHFAVKELFEVWLNKPQFVHATLRVDLVNGESIFYGDKAKLKSMLNEWVENSLRHNSDKADLAIHMVSWDEPGPPKRLVITYQDNGQGVLPDHKAKIFLPLFTTSPIGSGLGLFIIKRTIKQMQGEIVEKGEQGVMFEVLIAYTPLV